MLLEPSQVGQNLHQSHVTKGLFYVQVDYIRNVIVR